MSESVATRELVESFKEGAAVCEVYESRSLDGVKIYFDVRCSRQFVSNGERRLGPFIQQRDIADLMVAIIRAQKYISMRHAEIRRSRYAGSQDYQSSDGADAGDDGSFDSAEVSVTE